MCRNNYNDADMFWSISILSCVNKMYSDDYFWAQTENIYKRGLINLAISQIKLDD